MVSSYHHFHDSLEIATLYTTQAHKLGVVRCWLCVKIETTKICAECSMGKSTKIFAPAKISPYMVRVKFYY